jgi:hypothetical protein
MCSRVFDVGDPPRGGGSIDGQADLRIAAYGIFGFSWQISSIFLIL